MTNLFDKEFYPTPASVVSRMVEPYKANFHNLQILEPSAGTGAILDYITGDQSKYSPCHTDKAHVWALEKNEECAMILQGKGYRMLVILFACSMRTQSRTHTPSAENFWLKS